MINRTLLLFVLAPLGLFSQPKEQWIEKPNDQWPTIALVNDVLYKNGDRHQDSGVSYAGTGFLLNIGTDTLAVTAKHILYAARNRATDRVLVNEHLEKWRMHPKDNPTDSVVVGRLINEDAEEKLWTEENGVLQRDWIVFTTTYVSPNITPLKLSKRKVDDGERVHLIGNPYSFNQTLRVSGTVIRKMGSHLFVKFDGMEKQFLGGASGSPVVNSEGHLIGIFSNSTSNPSTGAMTFLINTTDYLERILHDETPLNVDRNSVSMWLDSLMQHLAVEEALNRYTKMIDDPRSADIFELHYINWRHLQRIGEDLLKTDRVADGIFFLTYFAKRNSSILGFHIALAKAYRHNNENEKAVAMLRSALREVYDEDKPEIEKLLKEYTDN